MLKIGGSNSMEEQGVKGDFLVASIEYYSMNSAAHNNVLELLQQYINAFKFHVKDSRSS